MCCCMLMSHQYGSGGCGADHSGFITVTQPGYLLLSSTILLRRLKSSEGSCTYQQAFLCRGREKQKSYSIRTVAPAVTRYFHTGDLFIVISKLKSFPRLHGSKVIVTTCGNPYRHPWASKFWDNEAEREIGFQNWLKMFMLGTGQDIYYMYLFLQIRHYACCKAILCCAVLGWSVGVYLLFHMDVACPNPPVHRGSSRQEILEVDGLRNPGSFLTRNQTESPAAEILDEHTRNLVLTKIITIC